ncbi:hypothetical protein [Arthrobacter sp. H41]|uniref:hypothetical protein n=1 Tax=Arthrobacter sp. H41 TaxID=1312978 RepID=UPI00047E9776|nr:hypothetical protein [Arthrobacter sp. H41]
MTTNYVRGASASSADSRAEIVGLLSRHGASGVRCISEQRRTTIVFSSGDRQFRLLLTGPAGFPDETDDSGREKAARRRWHTLALLVKAKLEAVNADIVTFEEEFLAYTVLPNGRTVFENTQQAISRAYAADSSVPLEARP